MSQINPIIATILKDNGLSITKQRLIIFKVLEANDPLSMNELYKLVADQMDRASLYRTIAIFEKLGIASRVNIGWKYKIELSDKFSEHHHHLSCLKCGRVISINEQELESTINQLASSHSFKPLEHQIEIQGYCDNCR